MKTHRRNLWPRCLSLVLALTLVVGLLPAAAATGTKLDHEHTDACKTLTCDLSTTDPICGKTTDSWDEEPHTHTDACYETVQPEPSGDSSGDPSGEPSEGSSGETTPEKKLICGKTETEGKRHEHTSDCYHAHTDDCYDWHCTPDVISVTGVTVAPNALNLPAGGSATLEATVAPEDAANKTVTWSSDNTSVATVSNGTVTVAANAAAGATATITATTEDGNYTDSCTITVTAVVIPVTGVTVKPATASIGVGATTQLSATVAPNNAEQGVTWTSDKSDIATVSSTGLVTGKKAGIAVITATTTGKDKDGKAMTASCTVTVTATGLTLNYTSYNLALNQNLTLRATTTPSDQAKNVTWSTSNTNVARVGSTSNTGSYTGAACTVYPRASGTAVITAKVIINGVELSKTCRVTVSSPTAATIKYSTDGDTPVDFAASDFRNACSNIGSGQLDYISFSSISSSYGNLYYNYNPNTENYSHDVDKKNYTYSYASTGDYPISRLTYVPRSTASRTITLTYTGWTTKSGSYAATQFTGEIQITVGAASGDLTYSIDKNDTLTLDDSDFNALCKKKTGYSLDYVRFTSLPSKSQGYLYYDYNSRTGDYEDTVGTGTRDRYYYNDSPYLDRITFVPAEDYTGTVTIEFTAYSTNSNSKSFDGELTIKVGKGSSEDISYTVEKNSYVDLDESDFIDYCKEATGKTFNYVVLDVPSTSRGVFYLNYTNSSSGKKVTSSTKLYRNDSPYLEDVSFVPAKDYTGVVSVPFTGYSTSGDKFSGTMKIYVGKNAGDITYTAAAGQNVAFKLTDFNDYCKDITDSNLNYVTLDTPSSSKGVLYYDYNSSSSKKVTDSTKYYRSKSPYVDEITFVPARNLTGDVKIPFEGEATNGDEFSGTVILRFNTIKDASVIRYTSTGSPVTFRLADFTSACDARGGAALSFVNFSIPSSAAGKLYTSYSSPSHTGGQISPNLAYNVSGTPALADVTFVPKAGFSGTVTLRYTGTDKNEQTYNGTVEITVTAPTASANFADVGSNYSWAAPSVDFLYKAGVVTGTDRTHYAPANNITRGDFVLMLYRAFGLRSAGTASFPDVPANSYYAEAIAAAKALGIAQGSNGKFNPTAPLTRQDAMLLIQRTLNATGDTMVDGTELALSTFTDKGSVASYARGAVAALVQAGIIQGSNGKLNPTASLTRAEMATILHRVLTK